MIRLIVSLLCILPLALMAQVVQVGSHYGVADPTTHRILVSLTADERDAADLPETFSIDNVDYSVQSTTLPIVRLESVEVNRENFQPSVFTLIDPEATYGKVLTNYKAGLRHRGATGATYEKKSFAVKFDTDASLLGMRNDNSWILDGMASDLARLRNRVSMDFWLDFSARPYYAETIEPMMVNGTRGKFVEMFFGNRYWGLYCLSEKVDRKQLKLKKYDAPDQVRGVLYKSFKYDNLRKITDPNPDNTSSTWQGWEGSYPDVRKGEPFDWAPLLNVATTLTAYPDGADFYKQNLRFLADLPVWCDYELFCELLMADDNACKNQYLYYRDITASPAEPLCICPWDLDATWGQDWQHQHVASNLDCVVAPVVLYQVYFSQPDCGVSFWERWEELRKTYFSADVILPYFRRYFELFESSGAGQRETERWNGVDGVTLDFKAEEEFINRWVKERIKFLDGGYAAMRDGIDFVNTATALKPVYTLSGTIVAYCHTPAEVPHIGLPVGIYIVNGKKIVVR